MSEHPRDGQSGRRPGLVLPDGLRVTTSTAADRVVGPLRRLIFEGQLEPDTPLREVVLAESFGVSRNTVRAAIHSLTYEGLVRHERNRGAVVVRLTGDDAHDLYATRRVLEVSAVDKLPLARERLIEAVNAAFERLERAVGGGQWAEVVMADIGFHRSVVGLHDSPRLLRCFTTIESELAYFLSLIRLREQEDERPREILAEHRALRDEVRERNVRRARAAIVGHLAYYEERASSFFEEDSATTPSALRRS